MSVRQANIDRIKALYVKVGLTEFYDKYLHKELMDERLHRQMGEVGSISEPFPPFAMGVILGEHIGTWHMTRKSAEEFAMRVANERLPYLVVFEDDQ